MKSSRFVLSLFIVMILMAVLLVPTSAQAAANTYTASSIVPIEWQTYGYPVFIPCANGGAGEDVVLTGNLHDLYHYTINDKGGALFVLFTFEDNPQGVTGYGSVTGVKYQATGVTRYVSSATVSLEETWINNFRMIGQGTGSNFLVHETYHATFNASGELTVWIDNISVECQ